MGRTRGASVSCPWRPLSWEGYPHFSKPPFLQTPEEEVPFCYSGYFKIVENRSCVHVFICIHDAWMHACAHLHTQCMNVCMCSSACTEHKYMHVLICMHRAWMHALLICIHSTWMYACAHLQVQCMNACACSSAYTVHECMHCLSACTVHGCMHLLTNA